MMTLAPVRSIEHAVTYYERSDHADYYATDEVCPSYWAGKGASCLGIESKPVVKDRFAKYLAGEIAGQIVGPSASSEARRKVATDAVLNPCKSVSLAALVGGDERVLAAHDEAVNATVAMLESQGAYIRKHVVDETGRDVFEHVHTGNLLCAVFRHETSRALSPHLHSHVVVLNASKTEHGAWRSIESRHLYCLQKKAGLYYRQHLSAKIRDLGYKISRTRDGNFEIEGFPSAVLDAFSQRRDAIDRALEKEGFTRQSAPASLKERLARRLREKKVRVEKIDLLDRWRETERQFDFDSQAIVKDACARSENSSYRENIQCDRFEELEKLFESVLSGALERDSVVSDEQLKEKINREAVGYGISPDDVDLHIKRMAQQGKLLRRVCREYSSQFKRWWEVPGYTSPSVIDCENELLERVVSGAGVHEPIASEKAIEEILFKADRHSLDCGFDGWNSSQRTALRGILSTRDSVVIVQGFAGTAKTSTVLRELVQASTEGGYKVVALAPSASACQALANGANITRTATVASHLLKMSFAKKNREKQVWIVDEASLLGTKDLLRLVTLASKQRARVVLVGDKQQLGSVQAGAAFRQLQEHGLATFELDEIVRQQNENARAAVYASIDGDAKRALGLLSGVGGEVVEVEGPGVVRHSEIAKYWVSMSQSERGNTLIIEPSREGRKDLTQELRAALKEMGALGQDSANLPLMEKLDHTESSRTDVLNYQVGDIVRFGKNYKSQGVEKHSYWTISECCSKRNTLTLVDSTGRNLRWNPAGLWGARSHTYRFYSTDLRVGDRVLWTQNDRSKALTNGTKGVIESIDSAKNTASVRFQKGDLVTIDMEDYSSLHWAYDYVSTAHAAQGQTADRVIYHAESFRRNLASQKAFYVSLSRARHQTIVFTDNRAGFEQQVSEHTGEKKNAVEFTYEEQQNG